MTELETRIADNRAAVDEFIATARAIDEQTWTRPRAADAWSPGQIVEHLALVYEYSRDLVLGTATGGGAPRILRPLARWFIVTRTLKAGKFTRKGRAPAMFRPSATPADSAVLTARLKKAVDAFEAGIRSGHPAGRHTLHHPFFGSMPMIDYVRLQAIHARHHRSQLT